MGTRAPQQGHGHGRLSSRPGLLRPLWLCLSPTSLLSLTGHTAATDLDYYYKSFEQILKKESLIDPGSGLPRGSLKELVWGRGDKAIQEKNSCKDSLSFTQPGYHNQESR